MNYVASPWLLAAHEDVLVAVRNRPLAQWRCGRFRAAAHAGRNSVWVIFGAKGDGKLAYRAAYTPSAELQFVNAATLDGATTIELSSPVARYRVQIECAGDALRARSWLSPMRPLAMPYWPRDLFPFADNGSSLDVSGTLHTHQRGLRSGIAYVTLDQPALGTVLYLQNFTSLGAYFTLVNRGPADTVGGTFPELGYAPPGSAECTIPESREIQFSDAYILLRDERPGNQREATRLYLEMFADLYTAIEKPQTSLHDWPARAAQALGHLAHSPDCTLERRGKRYLRPYVGDDSQPPESMVQLTTLLPLLEYTAWSKTPSDLARELIDNIPSFWDPKAQTFARWLGGKYENPAPDLTGNLRAMDSWYLYHSLFNLGRLAKRSGREDLHALFVRSLPYAIRVARRFDYSWPVFFDLDTLEILRGETQPHQGGERDVAGLYALVLMQARALVENPDELLDEAKRSVNALEGMGFALAYQMNTTGFAAEALLRLFLETDEKRYLDLSLSCIANIIDNAWLWNCDYGFAKNYATFFGIFPLPDAPYLAAYEEMELASKFREYLRIGGDDVPPSVRLFMAEYCRYALDRAWYYYPDALPVEAISSKQEKGHVDSALAVPLEDLRDGFSQSGQVGQEVYGSGVPMALTARHFAHLDDKGTLLYCDYPAFDLKIRKERAATSIALFVAGDRRASCGLRIISADPNTVLRIRSATINGRPARVQRSAEGHAYLEVPGNSEVTVRF